MKFWSSADPHAAVAVGLGQASRLDEIDPVHTAHRDRAPDVDQPGLLLGMHAHVVAPEAVGELAAGRVQGELGPLVQGGPESLGARAPAPGSACGPSPRFSRLPSSPKSWATPRHSSTAWSGRMKTSMSEAIRSPSERPPPMSTLNPIDAVALLGRPQTDVVDLDPGTVLEAAGHRDLELAGQVGVLAVAGEVRGDGLGHRKGVDHLLGVDARDGAGAHVARRVAAGLHGGQPDVPEALPDPGHVGDADPVELDVLARREVGIAVAEDRAVIGALGIGVGGHPDLAHLGRRHDAAGDLDPHHEGVAALALGVHAHPLETLLLARHGVDGVRALLGVGVDDRLRHLEGMAGQLELLDRVQLTDVAVGADEAERPFSTAELHPIGIVQVARHQFATCSPHSDLSRPAQRPARGSSPSATGRVVGAQPIER